MELFFFHFVGLEKRNLPIIARVVSFFSDLYFYFSSFCFLKRRIIVIRSFVAEKKFIFTFHFMVFFSALLFLFFIADTD